ncbi:kinetochore-associated protein 1-like [Tachypleus tridentatus]|uniref:kinetochore-associated protein 1-like n=1 Tax=Tachypleus tridentatus TaxID=6853 RepID=UPI003FD27DAF
MHFQLDLNMLDSSTKTDHENLQRVIHLLHHNSIEDKALHLLNIALKDDPSIAMKYRARALRCLISLCDQTTIQRLSGQDIDSIIDLLECLMYSSQLETFGLPYTPTDFKLCAKDELLESLLTMQGHNPDVLKFVVCLCIDKKMWDPKIWTAILRNMKDLYMMENLFHLQNYLSAVPELWHLPIYVKVWEDLLNPSIRHQGQKEYSVVENYVQLIRCPCLLKLDAHFLIEELKISKKPVLALVILFLTCSSNNVLQVFLESVNFERIEKDFEQLSKRGTTLVNWVKNWYEETKKHTN